MRQPPNKNLAARLTALLQATRVMASSLDLEQSLQAIIQQATIISGINVVRLFLLDEEARVLRYRIGTGIPVEEEQGIAIPVGESFSGQVAATGKPVAIADTRKDRRLLYPQHVTKHGLVSYLGLPVMIGDRILGVLVFNTSSPRTYSDEEIAYLSVFADQAAIAIENARLFQEERAGRRQLEAVRAVSTEIARELDLDAVLDLIVRRATELTGTGTGTVYLWDEKTQALFPRAWHGHGEWIRGLSFRLGEGVVGTAAQRREGLMVNDYRTSSYGVPLTLEHTRITAVLAEPLLYGDRLLGVIGMDNESTQRPFTQEDRDILTLFAGQAAIAIENARLLQEERDRRRQLEAVRVVTEEITRELDLSAVLGLITRGAADLMGISFGAVYLWDEATEVLTPRAWHGFGDWMSEVRLRPGEAVAGVVAQRREGMIVNDLPTSPYGHPLFVERSGIIAVLAEPLLYRDRLVGVIAIGTDRPGESFTPQHRETLALFAAQAAFAIENARLYGEALEKTERLEGLTRTSAKVAGTLRLEELLDAIVQEAAKLLRTEGAGFRLLEGDRLVVASRYGLAHYTTLAPSLHIGESLAGLVAQQGRPLMVPDQREDPQILVEHRTAAAAHGAVAYLGVPVRYRDRIIGVLHVDGKERRTFSEEEIRLLSAFADHAAIAIENARLFEATERAARETRSLYEVAHTLTTSLDPAEVLHLISVKTTELLGTPHAQVVLWDEETKTLRFGAAYGTEAEKVKQQVFRLGEGVNGIVAETRKPLLVNDYQRFPKRRPDMTDLVAVIGVPLLYRGRLLGVLTSHATQAGTIFTADHLALLTSFANQAAIAIENARLYDALRRTSEELESRVEARTRELREAHEELVRRERLALVGQLAGGVGHELRNPLGAIGNAVYYLRMRLGGGDDMKVHKHLAILETEVRRANKIVTDLLDFSRVKQPSRAPAQLNAIIRDILARQPQPSSLKRELDLIESLPPILVDPDQVGQVVQNLVINAIEAMPDGGTLTIRTWSTSDAVVASVSDTGIGIPPENLEKIFQPLFSTKTKGIGLGLAVSRRLIDANGGALSVESQVGKGSTFTAIFPIEESESVTHG